MRAEIEALAQDYGAEEVIVVTITHDHEARRRSYELLAEVMGLEPRRCLRGLALAGPYDLHAAEASRPEPLDRAVLSSDRPVARDARTASAPPR